MGVIRLAALGLVLSVLAGCGSALRDKAADAEARTVFDQLLHRQNAALLARMDPRVRNDDTQTQLSKVEQLLPPGEPGERTIVASNFVATAQGTTFAMTDQYAYPGRVVLLQTRLFRASGAGPFLLQGLHVDVNSTEALAANDFTLRGKSAAQYGFLSAALVVPLVILAAIVKAVRTAELRRKWLWVIISAFGVGGISMNWTTGAVSWKLLNVQLLGTGALRMASPFAPWILTTSLPIVAILILAEIWANPSRRGRD